MIKISPSPQRSRACDTSMHDHFNMHVHVAASLSQLLSSNIRVKGRDDHDPKLPELRLRKAGNSAPATTSKPFVNQDAAGVISSVARRTIDHYGSS